MKRATLFLLTLIGSACQTAQEPIVSADGLIGSWQYVERGYSPGAGYIVESIPRTPVQRIDFLRDSTVRRVNLNDQLFASARTYRIDSTQYGSRITFYDAGGRADGPSMAVGIRNDTLRISPSCFEGCHFAFVRLRN